jgi:hypothetical protein
MVMSAIQSSDTQIIFPMDEAEARSITSEIRSHLRDCRNKVLRMAQEEGWRLLGYESFQDWAKGEFDVSWQQVYNIKAAAEFDQELSLYSPQGEIYQIPIKHATQLRKLKNPESRVRAYNMAERMAGAQGKEAPTEKIVADAVNTLQAEETALDSPYPVVRHMLAASEITSLQAEQIVFELDRLRDEPAQGFVQDYMGKYGLKHPELIYPIGHKFLNERQRGKRSYVLDEIDRTGGYLAGTYLSKATPKDLMRANKEAEEQHIAEGVAKKQAEMRAAGILIEEQFALTLWRNSPIKSVKELIRLLPPKDLEAVFHLLAKELGYVASEAMSEIVPSESLPDAKILQLDTDTDGIEDEKEYQVLFRVKPEEKTEGKIDGASI